MRIHLNIEATGAFFLVAVGKDKLGWTIQDLTEEARVVARRPQIESLHLMTTGGNVSGKRKALVSRLLQLPARLHPPDRAHAVLVDGDEIVASDESRLAPLPPQSPASAGDSSTAMSLPACSSAARAVPLASPAPAQSWQVLADGVVAGYASRAWLKSEASTRGVILTPSPRAPARSRFPLLPPIPVAADTKSNKEAAPSPWLDALIATRAKLLERSVEKDQQIAELEKQVADLRLQANKLTVELPLDADWAVDNYGRKIIPVQYPGSKGKDA